MAQFNSLLVTGNSRFINKINGDITGDAHTLDGKTITDTYSSTSTNGMSGKAVASALGTLDVTGASSISASKTISAWSETDGKVSITTQDISITKSQVSDFPTLGTASAKDVPSSGNASSTQVVMGNDTRLTNSRTPTSHTHGKINNDGQITTTTQSSDVTIANNDKLIVADNSDSNRVVRTSVTFDGSTTTQCLTKKGTWASFTNNSGTVTSVGISAVEDSGINVGGGPITSSGTLSVGLNLSTAINNLSAGTGQCSRDDYLITEVAGGGGSSSSTYHRRAIKNVFSVTSTDVSTALGYTPAQYDVVNFYRTDKSGITWDVPASGTLTVDSFVIGGMGFNVDNNYDLIYGSSTSGMKYLKCRITWTTEVHTTSNLHICTLPTTMYPATQIIASGIRDNGSGGNLDGLRITIDTAGNVYIAPTGSQATAFANYKRAFINVMYI